MITSRVKLLSKRPSRTQIWRERIRLFGEGCLGPSSNLCGSVIRPTLYKLFEPLFKKYYVHEAKKKASIILWNNIYCGETKGLVSVVLPVYNQGHLLEESVESVLSQQYQDLELIIVNDGSTDGVERVLDKYVNHPKVVVLTQRNRKLPAALNTGFAHARGEFYTWTSADNIMLPNQLKEQVQFLRENDFVQMVYCNYELMDEEGRPLKHLSESAPDVINTDQDIRSLNYTYNFINACFMYRSYVARIIGNYHPDVYGAEDYDYWMRISNCFAIQHIGYKGSHYRYRVHTNTILWREGEFTIDETIKRAQELDIQRQSFFQTPMTFYIPEDVPGKYRKEDCLSRQPKCRIVRYETCKGVDAVFANEKINTKTGLFLTDAQMKERECRSLVERCKQNKKLCTFGIVEHNIANNEIHELSPLDWIVVQKRDLYHSLSVMYGNKMLCLPTWSDWMDLYIVIANVHLFYRHVGRKAYYPVLGHSVYQ